MRLPKSAVAKKSINVLRLLIFYSQLTFTSKERYSKNASAFRKSFKIKRKQLDDLSFVDCNRLNLVRANRVHSVIYNYKKKMTTSADNFYG